MGRRQRNGYTLFEVVFALGLFSIILILSMQAESSVQALARRVHLFQKEDQGARYLTAVSRQSLPGGKGQLWEDSTGNIKLMLNCSEVALSPDGVSLSFCLVDKMSRRKPRWLIARTAY